MKQKFYYKEHGNMGNSLSTFVIFCKNNNVWFTFTFRTFPLHLAKYKKRENKIRRESEDKR